MANFWHSHVQKQRKFTDHLGSRKKKKKMCNVIECKYVSWWVMVSAKRESINQLSPFKQFSIIDRF